MNDDALFPDSGRSEHDPNTVYGLCGFAGSGKNTAASFLLQHTDGHAYSFAAALKDGAAAIFGWPREMLEVIRTHPARGVTRLMSIGVERLIVLSHRA